MGKSRSYRLSILFVLFGLLPNLGTASIFTLDIKGQISNQTCEAEASALSQRFENATGKKVVHISCLNDDTSAPGYHISLSYMADKAVQSYRADYGKLYNLDYAAAEAPSPFELKPDGIYPTFEACRNAAEIHAREFVTYTGLTPVSVACYIGHDIVSEDYALRILAFGTPQIPFFNYEIPFAAPIDNRLIPYFQKIFTDAGAKGFTLVPSGLAITVMYYAPHKIPVDSYFFPYQGWNRNWQECQSQLSYLNTMIQKFGASPALSFCVVDNDSGSAFASFLIRNSDRLPFNLWTDSGPVYSSFAACVADRGRMLALSSTPRYGKVARGAMCALDPDNSSTYRMNVYGDFRNP